MDERLYVTSDEMDKLIDKLFVPNLKDRYGDSVLYSEIIEGEAAYPLYYEEG